MTTRTVLTALLATLLVAGCAPKPAPEAGKTTVKVGTETPAETPAPETAPTEGTTITDPSGTTTSTGTAGEITTDGTVATASTVWTADEAAAATDKGAGLLILDVKAGDGAEIATGGSGTFHYTGWLLDGTKFDSSRDSGTPITFGLAQVIQGWQQGIPGMKVGGTRKLYVPAALGYGGAAQGVIPPNSDLVFEVELVSIP